MRRRSTAGPRRSAEPEEDEGLRPIPDRLLTELTAHRTLALRHALGERPDIAFLAALHALALGVFYTYRSDTCLELDLKSVQFGSQAPGLNDTPLARSLDERQQAWRSALPKESSELWGALETFDADSRDALFAHCVSLSVNAVHEAWNRRPKAFVHADRLAQAVDLDMAASWTPDRGQLPRPGHQGAHPAGRGGSARPACGRAHRAPEEGRDGDGGRGAARRLGLAARAAAYAGSGHDRHGGAHRSRERGSCPRPSSLKTRRRTAANRPWPTTTPAIEDEEAAEPTDEEEVGDFDESSLADEQGDRR